LLDVALERYDHLIRHPQQVVVDDADGSLRSVRSSMPREHTDREDESPGDAAGVYRFSAIVAPDSGAA